MPHRHLLRSASLLVALAAPLAAPAAAQQTPAGAQSIAAGTHTFTRVERAKASAERFAAGPQETLEIILADGASVALAPGAAVVLDRFAFDPATGSGEMALTVERGDVRVMGGLLNQRAPIAIAAGETALVLDNGGAFLSRQGGTMRAALLVAGTLEVRGGGEVVTLSRPGFETLVTAGVPTPPRRQPDGQAFADAARINPGLLAGSTGAARGGEGGELITIAQTEALDDPNLRRPEFDSFGGGSGDAYAVNLPDGTAIASLNPSLGAIASNGTSTTGDGAFDIVLGQDSAEFLSAERADAGFAANPATLRERSATTNRILRSQADDYGIAGSQDIASLSASNGLGATSADLAYLVSTTLPFTEVRFPSDSYIMILPGQVGTIERDGGQAVSVTLLTGEGTFVRTAEGRFRNEAGEEIVQPDLGVDQFFAPLDDFSRDTVFLLTSQPTRPAENFAGHALAVPFTYLFAQQRRLQVNRLTRELSLSTGNLGAASPLPPDFLSLDGTFYDLTGLFTTPPASLAAYRSFLNDVTSQPPVATTPDQFGSGGDAIDIAVRGLSAGFQPSSQWFDLLYVDPRNQGTLALDDNPRDPDNFAMLEAQDLQGRIITFATGDVGTGRAGGSIDSFVLSRGLNPADFTIGGDPRALTAAQLFRSFLPANAAPAGATLASTPFLVVNAPPSASGDMASRLFHADLALSADGTASTVSATLGALSYDSDGFGTYFGDGDPPVALDEADPRALVTLKGQTVGSTALVAAAGGLAGPTLLEGALQASSIGGGNLWNGTATRPGYAGYLVLENVADSRQAADLAVQGFSAAELADLADGGSATALNGSREDRFGVLRLATGVASEPLAASRNTAAGAFSGYVAGLHQIAGGASDGLYTGAIALTLDAVGNGASATIAYSRPIAQAVATGTPIAYEAPVTLALGDSAPAGGASAYIRPGAFGASVRTDTGATAAILVGEAVKTGLGTTNAAKIGTYAHVQWGFFFGDLLPQAGQRTHTALSTWAAGRRADPGASIRGTANYAGHAIGTVVGTFEQSWNLDARTASMMLDFDGTRYQDGTGLAAAPARPGIAYAGVLNDDASGRQARIDGELVDVGATRPEGTIGLFQIRGLDASYQADGTFAGDAR